MDGLCAAATEINHTDSHVHAPNCLEFVCLSKYYEIHIIWQHGSIACTAVFLRELMSFMSLIVNLISILSVLFPETYVHFETSRFITCTYTIPVDR